MRPEYLHYFLEIYHHRSISKAAHALHISQTTLSSILKAIEKELGFAAFLRSPTGVTPTAEGERLMDLAWEIDVRFEELKSLKSREEDNAQPIRLLMSPCINAGLAVPLSRQFSALELRGDLVIDEWSSTDVGPYIVRNGADIGVTHMPPSFVETFQRQEGDVVRTEVLYQDRACLILPAGHRLGARDSVQAADLSGERLATVTGYRTAHNRSFLGTLEEQAAQVVYFPNMSTMVRAVREQGMVGVSMGYAIRARKGVTRACQAVPFSTSDGSHRMSICLVYRSDRRPRYQERVLCSCIRNYFREFSHPSEPTGLL